jgi:hypothetical protein
MRYFRRVVSGGNVLENLRREFPDSLYICVCVCVCVCACARARACVCFTMDLIRPAMDCIRGQT